MLKIGKLIEFGGIHHLSQTLTELKMNLNWQMFFNVMRHQIDIFPAVHHLVHVAGKSLHHGI